MFHVSQRVVVQKGLKDHEGQSASFSIKQN